jgi:hypothetical protein
MARLWGVVGVVLMCVVAFAGPAGSSPQPNSITIGQTINSGFPCLVQFVGIQTHVASGRSFVVPSGTWQLTSWSASADATSGHFAAAILTQTGAHSFTVDAISPTEVPTPNTVSTFPWSVTVHGGQFLGLWVAGDDGACIHETGNNSDVLEVSTNGFAGKPTAGTTESTSSQPIDVLNVSATLALPVAPADVHHVYTCYSKFEQDGGEVDDPATAAMLVAAGRWYPTAIPGNIDGGENVGAYHLACNPPAIVQETGQYIGLGGAITGQPAEGAYAIAE